MSGRITCVCLLQFLYDPVQPSEPLFGLVRPDTVFRVGGIFRSQHKARAVLAPKDPPQNDFRKDRTSQSK